MSIYSSINNNKPLPSLGRSPSYSSPTNNKSNKGKVAIILEVTAIAVVITTIISQVSS